MVVHVASDVRFQRRRPTRAAIAPVGRLSLRRQRSVNHDASGCFQRSARSRASEEQHRPRGTRCGLAGTVASSPPLENQGGPCSFLGFERSALRCIMACPPEGHPPARSKSLPLLGTGRWVSDAEQPRFWPHGLPAAPGVARPYVIRSRPNAAPEPRRHVARGHRKHLRARLAVSLPDTCTVGGDAGVGARFLHPLRR